MTTITHPPRRRINDGPDSTIRQLRLSLGISQNELAIQAGVSRHSVIRQEQLCYPTPLPSIVSLLSDAIGTSEIVIESNYLRDVQSNRAHTGLSVMFDHNVLYALARISMTRPLSAKHPFQLWREAVCDRQELPISRIHFSRLTSIHPATLFKYESFKTGFPTPMMIAFKEMGLPSSLLDIFNEAPFNLVR